MTPCLEWQGRKHNQGYGVFYAKKTGKTILAHRAVYAEAHGPIPPKMFVCHKCDNPACVRLGHLYLGTIQDNNRDMVRRGRQAQGEDCGRAKLTQTAIRFIRAHYQPLQKRIWTYGALAKKFGVSSAAIGQIIRGKNWRATTCWW